MYSLPEQTHGENSETLFKTKRKLKSKKIKFKREKRADSRFRSCKPVKNANDRTTVLSLTFTHLSVTATWETFWMVLLSVIISTFWLFYLVFPFAKHSAYKLPKIWNPEHGIRSTNCIYISSIAMNLKVIYVKHSEMIICKQFITIGQLVLVHLPRTHEYNLPNMRFIFFRNFQAVEVTPQPRPVADVSSCMPHRPCLVPSSAWKTRNNI